MGDMFQPESANYASARFPAPRDFQTRAHESLRQGVRDGHRVQLVMAPTGAGKSYLGMRIIHEALMRGKSALFMCDRTTLINQTSAVADQYGLSAHGILQANHWRIDGNAKFQIASCQTLARRGWPEMDVIVIDECFPGETPIATPDGNRPISDIRAGDFVFSSCGISCVKSVFSKQVESLVTVRLSNGTKFECTEDHPVFTEAGWVNAGVLERGQVVFSVEDVRSLWEDDDGAKCQQWHSTRGRSRIQSSEVLREILRQEIEQSNAQRSKPEKDVVYAEANPSSAVHTGREWPGNNRSAISGFVETWFDVDSRIHCQNEIKVSGWIPASLQVRHSEPGTNDCDRSGRQQSLRIETQGAGSKEGRSTEVIRVESVTSAQSNGYRTVFNLRVSGHPSYFANGILVHNCHTQYAAWVDHVKDTKAVVVGLSATPFSNGLGKIFTNLVNAATMHDLTQSGVLVPMKVYSCTKTDMRGAATIGGEWSDRAAEERGMEIVGDVVSEWQKLAGDRKTIVFGATIDHCQEICRQFNEAGIMAATFTCDTKPDERKVLLDEYAKPDSVLRVLISVEALAKGFDVKDVGCVCDCRPLRKSLSTAIQMWGRGLRSSPETGKTDCYLLDFSGNIVRFAEDYADVFYNGLSALDMGEKLDKTIRKDDEEKPEGKACPSCGYRPMGKRCVSCGHEHVRASLVEHESGEMIEFIVGNAKVGDKLAVWEQAVTFCRGTGNPDTAKGRAAHLYRSITGAFPRGMPEFEQTQNVVVTRAVINKARANSIAFRARTA